MHQLKEKQSQSVRSPKASSEILPLDTSDANAVPQRASKCYFKVYSILCSFTQFSCLILASTQKGYATISVIPQNCPVQGKHLIHIHCTNPPLLPLQGNLKRYLVHFDTLPSDNTPQGTGQIQTHSSCTFSCKLLGLHLSGRRNGQVTQ